MNTHAQSQLKPSNLTDDDRPHLFRLSPDILNAFEVEDAQPIYDDMCELEIANDPYDFYAIEIDTNFLEKFVRQAVDGDAGHRIHRAADGSNPKWIFQYLLDDEEGFNLEMFGTTKSGQVVNLLVANNGLPHRSFESFTFIARITRAYLIALLATKNIERKTVQNSKRSISPRAKKDAERYAQTTTIRIGKITETYTSGGGIRNVRPHLRRGHIRTQHFGKGNAEVKKIFIQPVFVNADEGWINEQKKYRVVA